jgi:hypothetical protein
MRRVAIGLGLALSLLGCSESVPTPSVPPSRGAQVPLLTVETEQLCFLTHRIVDVIADPETGTPTDPSGEPFRWLKGFTAWRVGSEVEVVDREGRAVLMTGGRYWMCPALTDPWVVGAVFPCPAGTEVRPLGGRVTKCELGSQVD